MKAAEQRPKINKKENMKKERNKKKRDTTDKER